MRDVHRLVERYLRKMRKSFARMYWDDDEEGYDGEGEDSPAQSPSLSMGL